MRIGFDGKRAVQNFTGLGNYSRYVADILCHFYPENDYVLYAPKKRENKRMNLLTGQYRQLTLAYPATSFWKKLSSLWRVWGITSQLEKEGIELFHGLSNELPLNIHKSRIKSIVTIHDLIFLRYPQYYQSIDRKIYTYKFRKACENADKIIAISECTKRDIIRYFNIPDDKIEVVYQGCDISFTHPVTEEKKKEVRKKYQLPDHYIPTDDAFYRNHVELLAFHALAGKFRCAEEFRHISRIYGKHMVRNDIFGEFKPEFGKAGQDGPFIGDGVFQDVVESGNAIGSHHDKAVTNVVDFADFTRLKGFIFLHDTSSLYFGILIIAQGTLFVE